MIRALQAEHAEAYAALRREALADAALSFASSPHDDFAANVETVREHLQRGPESMIFGAFDGDRLAGSAGVYRDRHVKAAHKMHVWGMYVTPSRRGRGLARELLDVVIAHARTIDGIASLRLAVSASAPAARRVYERPGFVVWGVEPDALRWEGEGVDEEHMVFTL